jgi:hypothetical protein
MKLYGALSRCLMKLTQVYGAGKVPVIKPQAMMMYREMRYHSTYF